MLGILTSFQTYQRICSPILEVVFFFCWYFPLLGKNFSELFWGGKFPHGEFGAWGRGLGFTLLCYFLNHLSAIRWSHTTVILAVHKSKVGCPCRGGHCCPTQAFLCGKMGSTGPWASCGKLSKGELPAPGRQLCCQGRLLQPVTLADGCLRPFHRYLEKAKNEHYTILSSVSTFIM